MTRPAAAPPAPRITAEQFQAVLREAVPYVGQLGVQVLEFGWGTCRLRMPPSPAILRPGGSIAGPAQMALVDIAMYAMVMTRLGPVAMALTTSLNINFLRRPQPDDMLAEGRLLKLGKRLAMGEVALFSPGIAEPVAHATATYSIPPERGEPE